MLATLVLPFILFAPLETKDRPLRNDSTVSFPVGIYTFEEIARRLSTSEFTITSGVPLKLRAALVSLRDRPRSEAIELLEKSLDVKVKPQSDHGGVLTPDDTTAARALMDSSSQGFKSFLEAFMRIWSNISRSTKKTFGKRLLSLGPNWMRQMRS